MHQLVYPNALVVLVAKLSFYELIFNNFFFYIENPWVGGVSEYQVFLRISDSSKNFHRKNDKKIKYLINKCKDDQHIRYIYTEWHGEEWKKKQEECYSVSIEDIKHKQWTKFLCGLNSDNERFEYKIESRVVMKPSSLISDTSTDEKSKVLDKINGPLIAHEYAENFLSFHNQNF